MIRRLIFPRHIALLLFLSLVLFAPSAAQVKIPITVTDAGGSTGTAWIGWHPSATTCIDSTVPLIFAPCDVVIESELPPAPPSGVFDLRLKTVRKAPGICDIGQGVMTDIHATFIPPLRDTFLLNWQPGTGGYPITLRWPAGLNQFADTIRIRYNDPSSGTVWVDMGTQTSLTLTNEDILSVKIEARSLKGSLTAPGTPTLSLPVSGAKNQQTTVTLQWNAVASAVGYTVQVATDSIFNQTTLVFSDTSLATRKTVTGLREGIKYYWSVRAQSAFLSGCYATPPFAFTTALINPPAQVQPLDGATGIGSTPTLLWRKLYGGSSYRLLVSHTSSFSDTVADVVTSDSSAQIGPLDSCVMYYWKVQGSTLFETSPFSSVLSFTVVYGLPAEPVLALPVDGALISYPTERATLTWSGDICSNMYSVQIVTDTLVTQVVQDTVLSATTLQSMILEGEKNYYWRVAARNVLGLYGPYSAYRLFSTNIFAPTVPVLLSPANNEEDIGAATNITWRMSRNNPVSYQILIDTSSSFNSPLKRDSTSTDTTVLLSNLNYCTRYFWKVQALNSAPTRGYSNIFSFYVQQHIPGLPILLKPETGDTGISGTPVLYWRGDKCTQQYQLQISRSQNFEPVEFDYTVTDTFKSIFADEPSTIYYWRVRASNGLGNGNWSESFFKTVALTRPNPPVLRSPVSAALGVLQYTTLSWDSTKRTDTYRLQVSLDSGFTLLVVNDSTLTGRSKQIGPLLYSKTYYWRVNAKNAAGTSDYSQVWWFQTLFPPEKPNLLHPVDGLTGVSLEPELQWSIPNLADEYQLQVARDTEFSVLVYSNNSLKNQSWQLFNLNNRTLYYWHVRAKNSAGYGPWSETFSFTTTIVGAANWVIPITVSETGFGADSLYFGVHPNATYGIDPRLNEYELPPPMVGQFDTRFVDIPSRPGLLGQGLRLNYLPFSAYAQVDTFRFAFQLGTGVYPVYITWNSEFVRGICDSMVMMDIYGGLGLRERMDLVSSARVTNISTTSLLIVVYGALPIPTAVPPEQRPVPSGFSLDQNYPNPFNPITRIEYTNEKLANIQLGVYDVLGREVTRLAQGTVNPGRHILSWDGKSSDGNTVPSGVYYLRMVATTEDDASQPYISTRKMLFMK